MKAEFMAGNFGFASTLLDTLKKHGNKCPDAYKFYPGNIGWTFRHF
jgi:hypothetical protein